MKSKTRATWEVVKDARRKKGPARYEAVAELHRRKLSMAEIGKRIGVSKQRVHEMIGISEISSV